jgi:hypothetical protein
MKIIPICLADLERWRSNRFYRFLRFGFREGVNFLLNLAGGEGGEGEF